jgi:hypothetical protein
VHLLTCWYRAKACITNWRRSSCMMAKVAFSARIFVLLAGFAPRFAPHTGKPVHVERRSRNEPRDLTSPRVDALHGMVTQCQLRVVSVPTIQVLRRVLAAGTRRSAKTYERTSTAREKDVQRLIERGSRVWKEGRFPECRYTQSHQSRILRPCKRDVLGNRLPGLTACKHSRVWISDRGRDRSTSYGRTRASRSCSRDTHNPR